MENQHRQIKGYRDLSQVEIDLMNEIKTMGVALGALVDKLRACPQLRQAYRPAPSRSMACLPSTSAGYRSAPRTCKKV